jgi:hypothetical protein
MLDLNEIHHWIWDEFDEFGGQLSDLSVIATLKQSHCADLLKLPLRHPESLVACIGTVPVLIFVPLPVVDFYVYGEVVS